MSLCLARTCAGDNSNDNNNYLIQISYWISLCKFLKRHSSPQSHNNKNTCYLPLGTCHLPHRTVYIDKEHKGSTGAQAGRQAAKLTRLSWRICLLLISYAAAITAFWAVSEGGRSRERGARGRCNGSWSKILKLVQWNERRFQEQREERESEEELRLTAPWGVLRPQVDGHVIVGHGAWQRQ